MLADRGLPAPGEGLVVRDVRWAARDDDWYFEDDRGRVYWYDGKGWVLCPQGAIDSPTGGLR